MVNVAFQPPNRGYLGSINNSDYKRNERFIRSKVIFQIMEARIVEYMNV